MADMHSFDVGIAKVYGIAEAVILQHIKFWVQKNRANGRHYHDGHFWTYNSSKAFSELFPYLSARQISRILLRLKEEGLIKVGNYNKSPLDRTLWYTLTNLAWSLFGERVFCDDQNVNMHLPDLANGFDKTGNGIANSGKAIPDINTDINTDSKQRESAHARGCELNDDEIPFDDVPDIVDSPDRDICDVSYLVPPDDASALVPEEAELEADVKPKKKRKSKKQASMEGKTQFADFVFLTDVEYDKLLNDKRLGSKEAVDWCIEKLNDYKGSCDKTYSSDYYAIRRWVIADYELNHKARPLRGGKLTVEEAAAEVRRQLKGIRQNE